MISRGLSRRLAVLMMAGLASCEMLGSSGCRESQQVRLHVVDSTAPFVDDEPGTAAHLLGFPLNKIDVYEIGREVRRRVQLGEPMSGIIADVRANGKARREKYEIGFVSRNAFLLVRRHVPQDPGSRSAYIVRY